jgi:hypothetical protein
LAWPSARQNSDLPLDGSQVEYVTTAKFNSNQESTQTTATSSEAVLLTQVFGLLFRLSTRQVESKALFIFIVY